MYSLMEKLKLCDDIPICREAAARIEQLESALERAVVYFESLNKKAYALIIRAALEASRGADAEPCSDYQEVFDPIHPDYTPYSEK